MTCDPNPARSHHEKRTTGQLIRVCMEYRIEVLNVGVQICAWKPKENDTSMGKFLVKDQLAEIPISDDQYTRLFPCDGQDIFIRKPMRIMARGIHLRWDNWASVRYAEELNSGKSSVTLQRADRHGIVG